jgi:hypothetical protein
MKHGIKRVYDIIDKDVVAPRAAVSMDATSEGKGGIG